MAEPEPVHLAHFLDRFPLCWPLDLPAVGEYQATLDEELVTCKECLRHMAGGSDGG